MHAKFQATNYDEKKEKCNIVPCAAEQQRKLKLDQRYA